MTKKNKLSKRQNQIKDLLLKGLTKKQIAEELCLSYATICSHVISIFKKTQTHSVGQLCGYFTKHLVEENEVLRKRIDYFKRYKKMWDLLKMREMQERRG